MDDIDDITSARSGQRYRETTVVDIDSVDRNFLSAHRLNSDEPRPNTSLSRDLVDTIRRIDQQTQGRTRLPMESKYNVASVRIIPDSSNRSYDSNQSRRSNKEHSARSYRSPKGYAETRKPDKNMTDSERAYMWRMKFQRLNARNPRIPIPDTSNPDTLERLYTEAMRTDHYCSSTSTWLIYMGLGYGAFQYALDWMGIKLPPNFVLIQVEVMSHYPQLLKALGDPGGPSLGSSWPPWLKLMFVICVHTLLFIMIYKISGGNVSAAHNAQRFICQTGFMGGKPQGEEVEADNAMANVGGLLGGLSGLFGGNSGGASNGIGSVFQNLVGGFMGAMGRKDDVADIDLEDPPEPVSERPTVATSNRGFDSRRKTPFD